MNTITIDLDNAEEVNNAIKLLHALIDYNIAKAEFYNPSNEFEVSVMEA